ncbi:hypothetical protein QG516_08485 [Pedobacter gandavensis]|uniref:hypothetical protein n=1 Tax=Pedobacter gandavensis TaxID=2679963 RepID=UPI002478C738|nr:hypothetical protein [Pedobacter gandavensis]WGQ11686.1 hypothetical protein QG516_08485 [Pedobacter gandavensis]
MKIFLLCICVMLMYTWKSQSIQRLEAVLPDDTLRAGQGVIYGCFLQRIGITGLGFPQDIRIECIETRKKFSFRVKDAFAIAKASTFLYHIPAGNYIILNYCWTQSKLLGSVIYTEPIYKGYSAMDVYNSKKFGDFFKERLQRFTFLVSAGTLNYLGTWHFDQPVVSFEEDKERIESRLTGKYRCLNFIAAKKALPH